MSKRSKSYGPSFWEVAGGVFTGVMIACLGAIMVVFLVLSTLPRGLLLQPRWMGW